ncbi:MAG: hypothetical protein RL701_3340 [Pseudomonadota bacterium]
MSETRPEIRSTWDRLAWVFIAAGSALRVLWPLDMEWKYDEKWMFAAALRIARGQDAWPWVGMPSGVSLRNPGLSIWPFALLARGSADPVVMAQAIQWLNVLGLWGLAAWVVRTWPRADRSLGLWSVALFAVSPLAVLFSRKIWAQDLLIVLLVPWLWAQRKRTTFAGAALWGVFGALLGQLHMSGFFAAAALVFATLAFDRRSFPWLPWLLGSIVGALPLIPWLLAVLGDAGPGVATGASLPTWHFFPHALRHAFGLGLEYPLGRDYRVFLRGPDAACVHTHLNAAARYGLLALLAAGVIQQLVRRRKQRTWHLPEPVKLYGLTALLMGFLLKTARVHVFAHYLIVLGPIFHIVAVWLLFPQRAVVLAACTLQAFLSLNFLWFVHTHDGAPEADYGPSYRAQTAEERALPLQ